MAKIAGNIQRLQENGPLYQDVTVADGMIRFVIQFDRLPTTGAAHVARGLVGRALSDAKFDGELDEVNCDVQLR